MGVLCTRCLGPTQHLKNKYGQGFLLEVKLSQNQASQASAEQNHQLLENFVHKVFPSAQAAEIFGDRAQYKIPQQDVTSLADTFDKLEEGKNV